MIENQNALRKRIQSIRDNAVLTEAEKRLEMQQVMLNRSSCMSSSSGPRSACGDSCSGAHTMAPNFSRECRHYTKSCSQFYFSCCDTYDPCHRCHLERGCEVRPPRIETIVCNVCNTRQVPGSRCSNPDCPAPIFSKSHCSKCIVWTQSDITHCHKCGTCRIGNPEQLFHCDTCDACFFVEHRDRHKCLKKSMKEQVCPLCLEATHLSQKRCDILRCGHVVHFDCLSESVKHSDSCMVPRCPTCRKCLFPPEQAQPYWNAIRRSIQLQPLPSELQFINIGDEVDCPYGKFTVDRIFEAAHEGTPAVLMCAGRLVHPEATSIDITSRGGDVIADSKGFGILGGEIVFRMDLLHKQNKVDILCHDCEKRSHVEFHFLGMECGSCGSFNTARL